MLEQRKRRGNIRLVVLKARQVGMSTFSEALMSWSIMLNPNRNGLVVAHDKPTAETLFKMCKTYYDYMDEEIKPLKRYSTKQEFAFENPDDDARPTNPGLGSNLIITSANNVHSGIGRTLHAVHISEAARYVNAEGIVDGIFPALSKAPGTLCILESTARYSGEWFRSFCERATRPDNEFEFIFVPWFLNPEYAIPLLPGEKMQFSLEERQLMKEHGLGPEQIKFFRAELETMGNAALFKQSYPFTAEDAWITPGDQVFPWEKLELQKKRMNELGGPIFIGDLINGKPMENPTGRLTIWEMPEKGKNYDIGVDVALGTSSDDNTANDGPDDNPDWSVMCVLQRGTNRQVAEWRSRSVDVMQLAEHAAQLGYFYQRAQIAVEVNGIGVATNMHLSKMGYPNLYIWRYRDEASARFSKKIGWETNYRTKKWLISFAVHEMLHDNVIIRSHELLDEMRNFVHLGNERYGGVGGSKDDRVMAFLIALTVSDDENFDKWYTRDQNGQQRAAQNDPRVVMADKQPFNHDANNPLLKKIPSGREHDAWD